MHPLLHHLGDDACRGLLTFAHPKPLGPHGLDWLFVHFANVWGHGEDKRSFDGRRRFTRAHLPQILAAAQDPVGHHAWWASAEKPWQALACCLEISGALSSLRPEEFESSLPVHMDGSCNGLQHYAALGRDEAGARAVNLLPADAPQDVYSGVAALVAARVEEDARNGVAEGLRLRGLVDRKLVKQTVMTSVYGVTNVGARAQIENRLRERGALDGDREALFRAARYLADHTLGAIGEMFSGARGIMGWLADCAREVASYRGPPDGSAAASASASATDGDDDDGDEDDEEAEAGDEEDEEEEDVDEDDEAVAAARRRRAAKRKKEEKRRGAGGAAAKGGSAYDRNAAGRPVRWTTPLGLPVTQPYFRAPVTAGVTTVSQTFNVARDDADRDGRVTRSRQRSAFPPNYIHSLDSTHMMMTALRCRDEGVAFAGVHDSFWTHAGTVGAMGRLLREEFVELHTGRGDLLAQLVAELKEQHPGIELPPVPPRGRLDVSRVRRSRYFFS